MFNLFRERNKKETEDNMLIYEFPKKLRIQLQFIMEKIIGERNYKGYNEIHKALCEEYGKKSFNTSIKLGTDDKCVLNELIENEKDVIIILEIFELCIRYKINSLEKEFSQLYPDDLKRPIEETINEIMNEINIRLKESSVGYEMKQGEFFKINSQYAMADIIEPTLNLTFNYRFKNVNKEFFDALKEYNDKDYSDCISKCNKAFESTLKIICDENDWKYSENDGLKRLLDICFENELIPKKIIGEFKSLRSLLEVGVAPVRNKYSGHGIGNENLIIPDYLARYILNITGSCILFLIESSGL